MREPSNIYQKMVFQRYSQGRKSPLTLALSPFQWGEGWGEGVWGLRGGLRNRKIHAFFGMNSCARLLMSGVRHK